MKQAVWNSSRLIDEVGARRVTNRLKYFRDNRVGC